MTRTSRTALLTLTALVAACLLSVALFAQQASADITPSLTASYLLNGTATGVSNPAPGSHYDYRQLTNITTSNGDDIKRMTLDYPAGMIGDPNAITSANRCNVDYTGVTATSGSPSYSGCPASSKVGTIKAVASSGLTCSDINLSGSIYLLRNRPTANPEVPTHLGINLGGNANIWLLFCAGVGVNLNMTAKITLRPTDQGLRIQIIDDITKTDPIIGGAIQIKTIDQTISGMAPAPSTRPFLTLPTRCTTWDTKVYGRAYSSNGNVDTDIDPTIAGNDHKVSTSTTTPSCAAPAAYNPTFTLSQTNTQAGRPVGLLAVLDNPVVTTNTNQPSYAKQFDLTLPVGMKINPAIANRLGAVGCTEAQFLMAGGGLPVQDTAPTCPSGSEVGTVAVKAPEVTGDLVGKIYLGDPRPGDEAAGIYRVYIYAARGGLAVKFQGTATANAGNGQVVVSIANASSYGTGLPQFNYSKFTMDFNTNSGGVGFDDLDAAVSNPVASPNDAQQMLINPQVCGSYTANVLLTPWTSPNEAAVSSNKTLSVTSGTNGSCSFNAFAPTFSANLSTTQAGRHPDLDLTVTRGDRQDNIKNLLFKLPYGFAGSAAAVPTCTGLTQSSLGTCTAANALGTAAVTVGLGPDTLAMPTSTIYNVTTVDSSQTARLGIVTPAVVGPFDLGYVISYTVLKLDNTSTFRLSASTDLTQSINGIPVAYRSIGLTLNGMAGAVPFLQNPSATCASPLAFDATITSNGDLSGPSLPGSGSASAVVLSDTNQNLDCTTTPQPFTPGMSVTPTTLATAQPTGLNLTLTQPQAAATTQQSTVKNATVTMPAGLEINPGFASSVTACATATINTDITNATNSCSGPATKLADVTVTTPLLGSTVAGQVYLETPGATPATRYRVVMYLNMPGGMLIIRGAVTLNGSTTGGTAGSTGAVGSGTGQLVATFTNLPDVPWSSMLLAFNSTTPMFVNSDTVGTQTFNGSFVPYSTSSTNPAAASGSYLTNYNGTVGSTGVDPWAPTFVQTISSTAPNAHPDVTMTVNRPEKNQQLSSVGFALPSGLTGAPAAVPTCTQVLADAANCPANSRLGTVTATVGSALVATPGVGLATLSGNLYNTVAPASAPAKLTAVVPIVLGPFNLGSMTLPVNVAMRPVTDPDPYGLTASVTLPNRYEGVQIRYRSLQVLINGVAPGNGANFLTNPSNCGATKTTTATITSALANVATATQNFTVGACAGGFTVAPTITVASNPAPVAAQAPMGITANVASATGNPTMKQIKITMPAGVSLNAAVGNNGANTTCSTANINADTCGPAAVYGTASMTSPLIAGTFNGNIYLETPTATGSPDERFRVAIIVALPGQKLIIRGKIRVNGDTTVTAGGTGSVDVGTGIVTADFDNLPDLSFNTFNVAFNSGSRAVMIAPSTCSSTNTVTGQLYPYNNPATNVSNNSNLNNNSPCVATTFNPTFTASVTNTATGANPNLTMAVANAGANVDTLRSITYHMPSGFVANTNNVARCTQAVATAGNCATPAVGTATIVVGTNSEGYSMSGSVYNVVPNANEPARLQAIIPINIGPFVLGKFSTPVGTSLRADYGVDATATLPLKYEGIDARARSLSVTLNGMVGGQPFIQNPSVCQTVNNFNADISNGVTPQNKVSPSFVINGCPKNFVSTPTLSVTPNTTQAADPVGLTFNIGSAATNPTMKRVQLDFPVGMEINPAFANGLTTCTAPTVAGCASANSIATVSLTTPLLSTSPVSGNVYVVGPGGTAATRYKAVMIVDLPGTNEMIVQGAVTVNGSTDIPTASTGATGSVNTGTGKIHADFNNIPDLGFTAMSLAFNSGTRAMVVNPETNISTSFTGTFTNNAGGTDATATSAYTTTGASTAFNPSFTASASSYVANAHPTLTMNIARADKSKQLRNLAIHLPPGLTANTPAVPKCTQASAAAASCATTQSTSQVGTIPSVAIGSGTETYNVTGGKIFAVVPNATEPARFQAIIPVAVGPYNLGNMTVPISGSLRVSDYGIDLSTNLPIRYEGIAVRIQTMQMIINGTVNAANYMNNPSRCTAGTISADFTASDSTPDSSTANNSTVYTATGCPVAFGTNPTVSVSGISTSTQTPTGMTVSINSVTGNPSVGAVQLTLPAGMSLNPAVGNNAANTTCATVVIDAITTTTDACPAGAQQGTVSLTSPLLSGTFTGKVYLESPGVTAATRYKLAIVVALPGQMLIVHGGATVNGSTTIPASGTGAKDSGTGVVTATFPSIPDLAFSNLTLNLTTSNRSMLITPSTCQAGWVVGTSVSPNGGGAAATGTQNFTTSVNCTQTFAPTFSGTLSTYVAGANPNLTIAVTNGGSTVNAIRNLNIKLPVGLVANTTTVARCPQASATAGTCATTTPSSAVGTITTGMGANAEQLSLNGTVYNVVPSATEPAHLAAVIPVLVGPFNLGNLPVDISTALNDGVVDPTRTYGVDTFSTLPTRYEGIDVRVRSLNMTVNGIVGGQPFMINPSACLTGSIGADIISPDPITAARTTAATFTGCNRPYAPDPTLTVTPSTTQAGQPVGLQFDMGTTLANPTTKAIKLTFPTGFELNPAAGTGLNYCSAANLATTPGQTICDGNGSRLGTVTLTTPLLSNPQAGAVYLEQPGTTATTRYKAAIVVKLPSKDLILHGAITLNGSTTIPTGGTGAVDSGTGQITADFPGIPDLGFTNMRVAFNSGSQALFVNPQSCSLATFSADWTPNGTGAVKTVTNGYTPDTNCSNPLAFAPTFNGSVSPTTSAANPNVTLNFVRPDNNRNLRNITVGLPTGLVAATSATTRCSQATAAAGNCAANQIVGAVSTTIGSGSSTFPLSGSLYNVQANATEPARFAAVMPVVVGPFDLGKLSIPVPTTLRSDLGVDATAQLPTRYEGIAVRIRSLQLQLASTANGNPFMINPSKCQSNTVNASMVSDGASPATVAGSFNFTTTACAGFGTAPSLAVASSSSVPADPAGLTFTINSAASNPTMKRVQITFPSGMEINPAFGSGLTACATATIDAGGAGCAGSSQLATATMVTPLLNSNPTGKVYLETPGTTSTTRYKVAMVIDLPGQKLIVRGAIQINGSSTIAPGGIGAVDSGTGQISADFDNIPDLGFTSLSMAFNGGANAMVVNPETCVNSFGATFTPNSNTGATSSSSPSYPLSGCGAFGFDPGFTASVDNTTPGGHPNLGLNVTRADKQKTLKSMAIHLPTGLVANTSAVASPCSQASAAAATCATTAALSQVGSFSTSFGSGASTFSLSGGKIFQVTPGSNEPVRFAAIVPVVVGPFNLGNLTIPVNSSMRADYGIDATATMPQRYEGIAVRLRTLSITLNSTVNGNNYVTNPSKCQSNSISADFTAGDNSADSSSANNSWTFTTAGCSATVPAYNPALTASLSTTQRGKPVGLDLGFQFSGNSSSTKKIVTTFPSGMSINPGIGNYGSGMTCADALVQAGGASCPGTYLTDPDGAGPIDAGDACVQSDSGCHISSKLGTVSLDTPLLPTTQTGALYLLPPVGNQAATRYRLGLFVDLPGSSDLYTSGSVTVDGSSDVPTGGTGAVDAGDGQVVATFDNLPDLQFNNLTLSFKTTGAGEHALLTNPNTCGTFNVTADMSPWSRPLDSEQASDSFTTTDSVASCIETESADQLGYVSAELGAPGPDFNNPAGPAYYAGSSQPVTLTVNRPDSDKSIKRVKILLPPGLVGSADAAPTCTQLSADAGTCASTQAGSQIGTVSLKIGDSSDTYEIVGGLFNTDAPSNRPAKFTFIADVNVGPFAFGKVIVPIEVNLDSNDFSLFAETGDMPQVFEGIPVRISQMKIALVGTADQGTPSTADDKVFMSNPRSCSTTLHVRAVVTSSPGDTTKDADAPLAGPFTNCGSLNLNADTLTIENQPVAPETGHGPEHPTGLNVQVHQDENLPTQATLKNMSLALPGFRLSAPAANGLAACSATQLDNQTCPAASRVGTAWIDTSLLPKNQTSPDGPGLHSLWGAVYLETPGTASDGSDRYKLAIQLTGKTLITIRGIAHVNETTGEITTTFDNLPDIPFTDFRVELTGYKKVIGPTTTYFPLLLNPEGVVGSASTVQAGADLTPHSGTAQVTRNSTLPIEAAVAKTFTPNATSNISPLTSGGHPSANFVLSRGDTQEDIKNVAMQLPAGFLGSAAAVPLCPVATASAGNCTDQSKVGDVIAKIGQFGQTLTLPGKVYLTEGVSGDIAGMSIMVPAQAGPYDLGDYITQGRIQIRSSDHGITVNFVDVPKMFKGVPTHIQNMDITLPGMAQSTGRPFLYNASDCSPFNITTSLTPYNGAVSQDSDAYQASGCAGRPFSPTIAFAATSAGDDRTAPSWQIKMHSDSGDSTLKSTTVVLPSVMTVNVQGIGDACPADLVASRSCPATSKIGTVSVDTPLLSTPVTGTIYMAKSVSGQSLPDMLIDIPAPIDMQIRGANSFVTAGNSASQIKSTFSNLPDLIWGDMTMNITGGPKGILGLRADGACGSVESSFASHSGQAANTSSLVTGISGFCGNIINTCANPTVKVSTKGAKKKGNKKASTSLSLTTASNCKAIKAVRVTYPKGTKLNKKLILFNKKKKATKKNLKNLVGKAGTKSLTSKDFAISGSNGLKFNTVFPDNTRSISINTKNSALLPSYKTFCGDITKVKYKVAKKFKVALKKCQKKNVTFTFEITNVGGTAFRYNYVAPAGSKFFK